MKSLSKVEVKGLEALFYDELISLVSGFTYKKFLTQVINDMNIRQNQSILDFGCGSAMALCNFLTHTKGQIIGLDIGKTMLYRAYKKCKYYKNVKIFKHDIRKKTPFLVDKVFISFVLHGFEPKDREKIINSAYANLKQNGEFCILDYNEFDYYNKPLLFKKLFDHFECPLAVDFINIPIKEILRSVGFSGFYEYYYYRGLVRLLVAKK
ncbi:methyltransferase, UbiE-COQ5 family [Desulfurella amilsii]|uniref:Methyltransferase, UbiE-COQ5 family n=1 Tax=Desulfurella amilsii TaxID=1562698 RepID=A0A1X4XWE6_9BACT|nr:class I SAM-dependent methyltransferase [Desulfurella amilsii]OSS41845.1 methyltransferase, UbiE-COQ5 family [Desulfurella amilsii]